MNKLSPREIQQESLKILKVVDHYCRSNGIRYWLSEGTLLGAVRHKGFIPWDDDMDISMPRPDYERFVAEFPDSPEAKLYAPERRNSYLTYARVCEMSRTLFCSRLPWTKERPGVGIDVFPVNGGPDTIEEFDKVCKQAEDLTYAIWRERACWTKWGYFRKQPLGFIKDVIHCVTRKFRSLFLAQAKISKLYGEYSKLQRKYDFNKSHNYYSLMVIFNRGFFWPKSFYSKIVEVDFEDMKCPIPGEYDKILTLRYGDYMTPLPPEQRGGHSDAQTIYWRDK